MENYCVRFHQHLSSTIRLDLAWPSCLFWAVIMIVFAANIYVLRVTIACQTYHNMCCGFSPAQLMWGGLILLHSSQPAIVQLWALCHGNNYFMLALLYMTSHDIMNILNYVNGTEKKGLWFGKYYNNKTKIYTIGCSLSNLEKTNPWSAKPSNKKPKLTNTYKHAIFIYATFSPIRIANL